MGQLALGGILEQSFAARQRAITKFCAANVEKYVGMAEMIRPDLKDDSAIWSRVAFAILSANVQFNAAVKALGYAVEHRGHVNPDTLTHMGHVPAKADYLNALPADMSRFLRADGETWDAYRLRLQRDIAGLGLAKASFAACLLYPTTADLACIDTHMQKVYLGHSSFKSLSRDVYRACEAKVRTVAKRFGVCTFVAQWMIWDHVRGKVETHAIFPGAHKTETDEPWREW